MALNIQNGQSKSSIRNELNEKVLDKTSNDIVTGRPNFTNGIVGDIYSADGKKVFDGYEPIATIGTLALFRERMCDIKLNSVVGKTKGDYRYIIHEKNIWRIHLETGEFTKYADTAYLNNDNLKFDFDSDGTLYYVRLYENTQNGYYHIDVYRYQNESHQQVTNIRLFSKPPFVSLPMGLVIHDGILYFSTNYNAQSQYYIYCYRVPINQLTSTTTLNTFFTGTYSSQASFTFEYKGDLYTGCYRLKGFDPQQFEKINTQFVSAGEKGGLLVSGSNFLMVEPDSFLPRCVSVGDLAQYSGQSFLHGNYIYSLINNYLFRARIF